MSIQFNLIPEGEAALFDFLRLHHYQIVRKEEIVVFAIHRKYLNDIDWMSASVPFPHPQKKSRRRKQHQHQRRALDVLENNETMV